MAQNAKLCARKSDSRIYGCARGEMKPKRHETEAKMTRNLSTRALLCVCLGAASACLAGPAAAQSYLQSGELNSIRQSNQSAGDGAPGIALTPPAPRQERPTGVGAQFGQGMAQGERDMLRQREMSAASSMQMRELADPQRSPPGRFPGEPAHAQGSISFDGQGATACRKDPVSGQVQCGALGR